MIKKEWERPIFNMGSDIVTTKISYDKSTKFSWIAMRRMQEMVKGEKWDPKTGSLMREEQVLVPHTKHVNHLGIEVCIANWERKRFAFSLTAK